MFAAVQPSLFFAEVSLLIFVAYGIWIRLGRVVWLAATASFLALQGIFLIGLFLQFQRADVDALPIFERGLNAMICLWWLTLGLGWIAILLAILRCWRTTGSPLPFHRRPREIAAPASGDEPVGDSQGENEQGHPDLPGRSL
jgi:hypothetical protein